MHITNRIGKFYRNIRARWIVDQIVGQPKQGAHARLLAVKAYRELFRTRPSLKEAVEFVDERIKRRTK